MSDEERYLTIRVPADILEYELEALLHQVEQGVRASTVPAEDGVFRITVEVPAALTREDLAKAFEAVADAAHEWQDAYPKRTWDIFVAAGMDDHTLEAAFDRRGEAMRKALKIARNPIAVSDPAIGQGALMAIRHILEDL